MSTVFAKLNLKHHKQIVVLDSPGSFESELAALKGLEILRDLKKANEVTFSLAFVTTQEQVNALAPAIAPQGGRRRHPMVRLSQGDFQEIQVADCQAPRLECAWPARF